MNKTMIAVLALAAGLVVGIPVGGRMMSTSAATDPGPTSTAFAAVPGEIGGQDLFGPYDVVADWPKDVSTLAGHADWTWGAAQGIFAENPNRVYLVARGELPNLQELPTTLLPQLGPSVQFPVGGLPWRSHTQTALPGNGGAGGDPATAMEAWQGRLSAVPSSSASMPAGSTASSSSTAQGNIIEEWTQWDKIFKRPHSAYISPYDR